MNIKLENIIKTYKTNSEKLNVIKGINYEINSGEVLTIYGPSGAGKSTLLHLIGLIDNLTSGKIYFDKILISSLNEKEKAKIRKTKIGFVFQFHHLLTEYNAIENVMLPLLINGNSKKLAFDKSKKMLEKLGLIERLKHNPSELSGGEQQRIAIARALINSPEIVIADEPTGNLDSENSKIVYELLINLQKELKFTLLIVTHNMEIINSSNKIALMRDGVLQ